MEWRAGAARDASCDDDRDELSLRHAPPRKLCLRDSLITSINAVVHRFAHLITRAPRSRIARGHEASANRDSPVASRPTTAPERRSLAIRTLEHEGVRSQCFSGLVQSARAMVTSSLRIIAIWATGPPHASDPNLRKRRDRRPRDSCGTRVLSIRSSAVASSDVASWWALDNSVSFRGVSANQ